MEFDRENEVLLLNSDECRVMRMAPAMGSIPVCALLEVKISIREHLAVNRSLQRVRREHANNVALFSLKRNENVLAQAYTDLENIERIRWLELYPDQPAPDKPE